MKSSPYAGGAVNPLDLSGSSKVIRDSLALELANVGPSVFGFEVDAISDIEVLEALEGRVLINSDGL